jgi:transposase
MGRRDRGWCHRQRDGENAVTASDHPQKKSSVAKERGQKKRQAFREALRAIDPKELVFIDESGFSLSLYRHYGCCHACVTRAARGERLVEAVPVNRGKNLSLIGAPDQGGMLAIRHKQGAIRREDVEAFLKEDVLPRLLPGSVIVWDNAKIHQGTKLEKLVTAAGCEPLYLPPYSPDFSPIELAWGWIKAAVRHLCPRDSGSRITAVEESARALPPASAPNWFRNCLHNCGVQC